jgi:hypothetical protein
MDPCGGTKMKAFQKYEQKEGDCLLVKQSWNQFRKQMKEHIY